MAESAFDAIAEALESSTPLNRLEARGTLRLACKEAGVDVKNLSAQQIEVVLSRVMPAELEARGIEGGRAICEELARGACEYADDEERDRPEDMFSRLDG